MPAYLGLDFAIAGSAFLTRPSDVGPLMWIEEQHLLGSFLGIVIFDKARKMNADFLVLSERSETIHLVRRYCRRILEEISLGDMSTVSENP